MIRGCNILKKYLQADNTAFQVADFSGDCAGERADVGLLLDFIGKNVILKQKLKPILQNLSRLISKELHLSLHPEYDIGQTFALTDDEFAALYPATFIRQGRFYLLEYVLFILEPDWQLCSTITAEHTEHNLKYPLYFQRKPLYKRKGNASLQSG
jgi:hypothetical protein